MNCCSTSCRLPPCADRGGGKGVALFLHFLIVADTVLSEKVHGGSCPFQILNGRPLLVSSALLGLDVVLNANEQADFPFALPGLSGVAGASGDPGDKRLLPCNRHPEF